jgi:hypothetical protein
VTAIDDSLGELADRLLSGVGSDYRLCVEFWREQVEGLKCRVEELEADLEASTAVDLLERYRRVCAERSAMAYQLDLWLRGHPMTDVRRPVVESLVHGVTAPEEAAS